jgi:acetyl-CoA carboxylase carboxyl transferase subunit alpha
MLDIERPIVELEKRLEDLKRLAKDRPDMFDSEIKLLEKNVAELKEKTFRDLSAWQKVQIARHPDRPLARDFIEMMFTGFIEVHGDRLFSDDPAVIGGPANLKKQPVMVIGEQKGRGTKERVKCNFGMPHPEGYRKALRLMKMAEKFSLPVISLIDTQGAYPGIGAEERGQAWAIAENLREMSALKTPIICVDIGEGASGGALAMGVGDRIYMLENAYFSVITPEGCASILYKDPGRAEEAAESLKMTADSLLRFGIIDGIIPEPLGGAHRGDQETADNLKKVLIKSMEELRDIEISELLDQRYERLRKIGVYEEGS